MVTEYIIFPLGSEIVRNRIPEWTRSFVFFGPEGTGKTLVVRACVSETNSVMFDMSSDNTKGKYNVGKDAEKLVAMVMFTAKHYQPSIIYIDDCHDVFPQKKKGKKGKKKGGGKDPNNPTRFKKPLIKWRTKWINDKTRITIIGCTSNPEGSSKKEFRKFFDKAIFFPFPDYTTRRMMWKSFIESHKGELRPDFPLSTLAHITEGYSAGSIKRTVDKVLTDFRVKNLQNRPLTL